MGSRTKPVNQHAFFGFDIAKIKDDMARQIAAVVTGRRTGLGGEGRGRLQRYASKTFHMFASLVLTR